MRKRRKEVFASLSAQAREKDTASLVPTNASSIICGPSIFLLRSKSTLPLSFE